MGRTPCCNAELGLKKGAWTSDEDQKLIAYIKEHGEGGWRTLPEKAGLQRCGKSCRLRWTNYLRPDIKRGEFTAEEEQKIFQLHATLGNRWSAIARNLPMRTDNEIKNYWNTHLKKRLLDVGVDLVTQNPLETSSSAPSTNPQPPPPSVSSTPSSLPPSSVSSSAHRLNMLASKIASSSISHCNIVNGDKDLSLRDPSHSDSPPPSSSSNSSSARLLNKMANRLSNKMANRLSSPLHCLNTLKTIMSRTADRNNDNSDYLQRSTSASSLSESTVSDVSRSISASTGILNDQTATYSYPNNLSPFNNFDDLDLLKDWHAGSDGVVSSSCGVESPVVQGCGGNHESAELENLLRTYRDEVNNDLMTAFRATYEHDDMAMDMGHDVPQYLLDGITNHYAVDDAPPHFMSASNTDSRNAAGGDGGEIFELSTYDDFNLEYCNFSIMSDSDNIF